MTEWSSSSSIAACDDDWISNLNDLLCARTWSNNLQSIVKKLSVGVRLTIEDGRTLYSHPNLSEVGQLAHMAKLARFGENVFFNSNVHINQTNICVLACKFCAFRRSKRQSDAYAMTIDEYLLQMDKFSDYVDEIHSVGGLHPDWDVDFYSTLLKEAKKRHPHVSIKALTAVEVKHIAKLSGLTISQTLSRLISSGLDSLPGGGAEILNDDIRAVICNGKESSQEYLDIHRQAHELGIPSNCTMLFGTIESIDDRLHHMDKLRKVADETSLFQCFVPYPFLPDSSRLPQAQLATANEILRTISVSRLMLDSIPHVKAYRMNIGDELAELALHFGADDIDGTVGQESIMHLAGATSSLDYTTYNLAKLIKDAGFSPVKRNTTYTKFKSVVAKPPERPRRLKVIQA